VEGVIQKAPKVLKYAKMLEIEGWDWLADLSKTKKSDKDEETEDDAKDEAAKVDDKYMRDIIGGRPVLAYPQAKGGFRLRYGRSRTMDWQPWVCICPMEIVEFWL
jgi:DNA polymerase II large subunit